MELWEILDDNGNPTGEIMEKYDKKVFDRGLYHLGADGVRIDIWTHFMRGCIINYVH